MTEEHAVGQLGPEEAFEALVVPELTVLLHVARILTRTEHDAEDLVQDTLLRAYRGIGAFDGAHPRAWLFTIMRHAQANRTRRRRPELLDDPGRAEEEPVSTERSPEEAAVALAFRESVAGALARLPRRLSQVVELVDLDDLSYREAADALAIPLGTVMSRLHRARRKIRSQLAAEGLAPRGGVR